MLIYGLISVLISCFSRSFFWQYPWFRSCETITSNTSLPAFSRPSFHNLGFHEFYCVVNYSTFDFFLTFVELCHWDFHTSATNSCILIFHHFWEFSYSCTIIAIIITIISTISTIIISYSWTIFKLKSYRISSNRGCFQELH